MLFVTFILFIIQFPYKSKSIPPPPELTKVQLDCHRMPSSFCCSNRIRSNCASLCASFPTSTASCLSSAFPSTNSQIPTKFLPPLPAIPSSSTSFGGSIDFPNYNQPNPEDAFIRQVGSKPNTKEGESHNFESKTTRKNEQGQQSFITNIQPPFQLILPPPDSPTAKGTPVPIEEFDSLIETEQTRVEPAQELTTFPTLIPHQRITTKSKDNFAASVDAALEKVGNSEEKVIKSDGGAMDGIASRKANNGKKGPLKPKELMKELEEIGITKEEEEKEERENEPLAGSVIREVVEPSLPRTTVTERFAQVPPKNFSEFPPPPANQLWSFKIKPSSLKESKTLEFSQGNNSGNLAVNDEERSEEEIENLVDQLSTNKDLLRSFVVAIKNLKNKNNRTLKPKEEKSLPHNLKFTSTSIEQSEQCSTPPKFIPCVPLEKANAQLHGCCVKKLMPIGCLPLCRYDTSREEIKMAFEKGQCGLLNISPFLECASQGKNNLNCCKHRNITQKSAQQCEVFCTGEKLTLLGIQHLVCSTLIQPILECHHAGLEH